MSLPDLLLILSLLTASQIVLAVFIFRRQEKFFRGLKDGSKKKPHDVLGETELKELEGVYEDQLLKATEKMEKEFSWMVGRAEEEFGKFLKGLERQSRAAQETKIGEFNKVIDEALVSFTKKLLEASSLETQRAKDEVGVQKKQLFAKAETDVAKIVAEVSKTVLGKTLTDQENAQLIAKALEQARQEEFVK